MKKLFLPTLVSLCLALGMTACKKKEKVETPPAETTTTTVESAPVVIAADDTLTKGVADATKDFPTVRATVSNGEITLTGEIARDRLPVLMQSLSTLHPKKINNELTINR